MLDAGAAVSLLGAPVAEIRRQPRQARQLAEERLVGRRLVASIYTVPKSDEFRIAALRHIDG